MAEVGTIAALVADAVKQKAIYVTARLGVVDKLLPAGEVLKTTAQLEEELQIPPGNLFRILRICGQIGLLTEHPDGRWSVTPTGAALAEEHPSKIKYFVQLLNMPLHAESFNKLYESVQQDKPGYAFAFEDVESCWSLLDQRPEEKRVLDLGMTGVSALGKQVVQAVDWTKYKKVSDVGGNTGVVLGLVLAANSTATGVNFDRPEVINDLPPVAPELQGRLTHVSGSFMEPLPEALNGSDAIVMKHIMHDWGNEACTNILKHCAAVLAPEGDIIIIDHLMPETAGVAPHSLPMFPFFLDLMMMGMCPGGRERSLTEWTELFAGAGLTPPEVLVVINGLAAIRTRRAA